MQDITHLGGDQTFVGPLLFFGYVSMFIIPVEESILKKGFGASYKAYTKAIRRWL